MVSNNVRINVNGRILRFIDAQKSPIYVASELKLVYKEEERFHRIVARAFGRDFLPKILG
jgi:hypothetical protein